MAILNPFLGGAAGVERRDAALARAAGGEPAAVPLPGRRR
jgi:hypothetical protein